MTADADDPGDPRLTSGEAWSELADAIRASAGIVLAEDAPARGQDLAEGFRYLTRFLAAGIRVCVELGDPEHPELGRMIDRTMTWGLDCPDCLYLYASVRGDASYRLFGSRGSANHFDVQVNRGHFASGDIASWGTLASVSGLELDVAPDGSFELALSPERQPGNWLPLGPDAEFVLVRQYFADWEGERPADLAIERAGAPASAPPPTSAEMARRLARLREWLTKGGALWDRMSRGLLSMEPNTLAFHDPGASGEHAGLRGQAYGMGNFTCAPHEAVVVEFPAPRCRHWSVSLASFFWESLDFATRQTSLNAHQARLDADGVFRGVIAHADPGVPNWLDTAGHERGTLAVRFLLAEDAPKPALRRVPLAELRAALPADTPRVTPEERAASLHRRRRAALARYRR